MFRTNTRHLPWVALGLTLTVCLMAPGCRTSRTAEQAAGECPASSEAASNTIRKLNEIVIPEMTFFAPATIVDAVDFLKQASCKYDKSRGPLEKRGVAIDLHLPDSNTGSDAKGNAPVIQALSLRSVSLYDALKVLCETTGLTFRIRGDDGRVMVVPHYGDEGWATRSYSIPPVLYDRLFSSHYGHTSAADRNKVWQAFFEEMGVKGQECARFEYLAAINKLRVTNTTENLAIIEQVVDAFSLRLVEVEVQIHAFRAQDIERLRLSDGVSVESLTALRQKGRSQPVATAKALTKSGQEATVKAVREVLYPTELLTDSGQTGSNVTTRSEAKALMPGSIEMRETGMILQVIPEVEIGGAEISLILNPSWVALDGWETYPAGSAAGWIHKTFPFRQPVFGVMSFQTRLEVPDGGTVLLGSCSTPDGEWVQVGFLTPRLREVHPAVSSGVAVKTVRNQRGRCLDKAKTAGDAACSTVKQKLRDIVIPEVTFRPPATIVDAVRFFKDASFTYDKPGVPKEKRGVDFVLKLPEAIGKQAEGGTNEDPFAAASYSATNDVAPVIAALSARFINLYDALKLVCDVTGMKFRIKEGTVWIVPMEQPDDGMVARYYSLLPPMGDGLRVDDSGQDETSRRQDNQERWKSYFARLGVSWPCGSSFMYLRAINRLRVMNTPENLEVFEQVLDDLNVRPSRVEVDVQIHAFRSEDLERLRQAGDVSVASLMALRKNGRSEPLASAMVVTKPGQEAVVKSVREMLYPTELDSGCCQMGANGSSEGGARALAPSNFEMREVGMILQVIPEVISEPPSLINLIVNPQWVTLDRWISYPADLAVGWTHKALPFRQPVFGVTGWQTQVTVKDGGTVLLGSSATPDGKWVQVGFLTARRVNVQSEASGNSP